LAKNRFRLFLNLFSKSQLPLLVLTLFAIANTCIPIGESWLSGLTTANSLGIVAGLVLGKPLGIALFSLLGVSVGLCVLPKNLTWQDIIGVGFLGVSVLRCRYSLCYSHLLICTL